MADPSLINQWLQHHGYSLHPGDARAITQCYTDTMLPQNPPFDEAALHQCAVAQGLTRHPSRIPELRRCPSLPSMLRDTIFTRVRQFWNTVSDADYDAYLALPDLIDQMLDGPWYRTRIENVGYDRSSYPQAVSYRPWLLTEFASVYDAYDHVLTGEPIPTFVSGSGMAAQTWADTLLERLGSLPKPLLNEVQCLIHASLPSDVNSRQSDVIADAWLETALEWLADEAEDGYTHALQWLNSTDFLTLCLRIRPDAHTVIAAETTLLQAYTQRREFWRSWQWPAVTSPDAALLQWLITATDPMDPMIWTREPEGALPLPALGSHRHTHRWYRRIRACLADWNRPFGTSWLPDHPFTPFWLALTRDAAHHDRRYYLTWVITGLPYVATFGSDNWEHWITWAHHSASLDGSLIVRRFEPITDPICHLPWKTVWGFAIQNHQWIPLAAEAVRAASGSEGSDPEPFVRYRDGTHLLDQLGLPR